MNKKVFQKIPVWIWVTFAILIGGYMFLGITSRKAEPDSSTQISQQEDSLTKLTIGNKVTILVEIADTPEKTTLGLSYRDSLPENHGMLFVFPEAHTPTFWMYEMKFPLDMIWIGEDNTIVDITENVPHPSPGTSETDLPHYSPKVPAKMVLEVNGGFVERHQIKLADRVEL